MSGQDNIVIPEFPSRLIIGLQDGYCNLKCPMCYVHGSKNKLAVKSIRGSMSLENACRIFDEVAKARPAVYPNMWTEPFVMRDISEYIRALKQRNIPVMINSNGLLLTNKVTDFLIKIKVDSVFISIDAVTAATYKKIRGIENMNKAKDAVFSMLKNRGNLPYPRIGVSFVVKKENRHEKEEFVSYWLQYVDTVRVNGEFSFDRTIKGAKIPANRTPCGALYNTMVVNHSGDAVICCLDGFYTVKVGNVLKSSVKEVWHSPELQKLRHYHQAGQYDKIPFCKKCQAWSNNHTTEKVKGNILIRRSSLITHYNRIDRANTWIIGR